MMNIKKYMIFLVLSLGTGLSLLKYVSELFDNHSLFEIFIYAVMIIVFYNTITQILISWGFNAIYITYFKSKGKNINVISLYPLMISNKADGKKVCINFNIMSLLCICSTVQAIEVTPEVYVKAYGKVIHYCNMMYIGTLLSSTIFLVANVNFAFLSLFMLLANYSFLRISIFKEAYQPLLCTNDSLLYLNHSCFPLLTTGDITRVMVEAILDSVLEEGISVASQKNISMMIIKSIANREPYLLESEIYNLIMYMKREYEKDSYFIFKNFNLYSYLAAYLNFFCDEQLYLDFVKNIQQAVYSEVNEDGIVGNSYFYDAYCNLRKNDMSYLKLSQLTLAYHHLTPVRFSFETFLNNMQSCNIKASSKS